MPTVGFCVAGAGLAAEGASDGEKEGVSTSISIRDGRSLETTSAALSNTIVEGAASCCEGKIRLETSKAACALVTAIQIIMIKSAFMVRYCFLYISRPCVMNKI
jgi:hypothetical protein